MDGLSTEMTPDTSEKSASDGTAPNMGFADELRTAIKASGLSLDRIQVRLQRRGVPISVTALSYWQSGKRQPERARSISAVRVLEEILERPPGSLVDKLRAPRPRGPVRRTVDAPTRALRFQREVLRPLLARLGAPEALEQHVNLQIASLHDRCELTAGGVRRRVSTRMILRANAEGQHRWVLIYISDQACGPLPTVDALRNCVLGSLAADEAHGVIVAELLFDRPLDEGESCLIEYSLTNDASALPPARNAYEREFRRPIREYLLEIASHPEHPPIRCRRYQRKAPSGRLERYSLEPGRAGDVHAVALDFGPGVFGIEWGSEPLR